MQKQASMIVHICKKNGEIDESLKERESENEVLYRKINELELRVENQEQYSAGLACVFTTSEFHLTTWVGLSTL